MSGQGDSRLRRAGLKLDAETKRRGAVRGDEALRLLGVDPDECAELMKDAYNQAAAGRMRETGGDQIRAVKFVALDLFVYGIRLGMQLERENGHP